MKTLMIQVLTIAAIMAVRLAFEYQTDGYGLSPVLAYPVATLLIGIPLMWELVGWMQRNEDEFEHIVMERAHCSNCGHYGDLVNGRCASVKC